MVNENNRITIYMDEGNDEYVLSFSSVANEDFGAYECVADNTQGETKCRVELTLAG